MVDTWDDCNPWIQAQMIAYDQIRSIEEAEEQNAIIEAMATMMGAKATM